MNDQESVRGELPKAMGRRSDQSPSDQDGSAEAHAFRDLVARLEADADPKDEYRFHSPFLKMLKDVRESGKEPSPELMAEVIAFELHSHDHQEPSSWGLYFGPMMSGSTPEGDPWESPALALVTPDVLDYWHSRAKVTPHPVMRARYADLLWEIPKALEHATPDPNMGRLAIDSYLECVETDRYEHNVTAIAKVTRALEIGLSLRDDSRVDRCKDAMLRLEEQVAEDESLGLWGFCFDTFVEPPHKKVRVTQAEVEKLVRDIEARLERFAAGPPNEYHPAGAQGAAIRLADYYRRHEMREDMCRVMKVYGRIVRRMQGVAAPLVTAHCLEELYAHFKSYEMHEEADQLNEAIRTAGEQARADLKEISVEVKVPTEKIEDFFSALLSGESKAVLARIAVHFIPSRQRTEDQVRQLAKDAPISYLMTHSIMDEAGRTVASVGPLEHDLEGHVLRQLSQNIQLGVPWLREGFGRGLTGQVFSCSDIVEQLVASPLFAPDRHAILEAGVTAYDRGDSIAAIHILVPQLEQALRQLAALLGAPIYTQRRGGGLHARMLDDLLRDPGVVTALGEDAATYLRVLLTDARGWNVRNSVCHGLASTTMLTMPVADRIVHALLVLGLVREREDDSAT